MDDSNSQTFGNGYFSHSQLILRAFIRALILISSQKKSLERQTNVSKVLVIKCFLFQFSSPNFTENLFCRVSLGNCFGCSVSDNYLYLKLQKKVKRTVKYLMFFWFKVSFSYRFLLSDLIYRQYFR